MIQVLLVLWLAMAMMIVFERKIAKIIIFFGIFSLITSFCFLLLGSPDVAMAEAAVSVFTTIFFVVCFEKYHNLGVDKTTEPPPKLKVLTFLKTYTLPLVFSGFLFMLFLYFIPEYTVNTYLKTQYIAMFARDVGGENVVTAIYLGYRVYDTLFEALILVVSVIAVSHMSWYEGVSVKDDTDVEIDGTEMAIFTLRIVCPLLLIFGIYLIANGQLTPGGGFQGGVVIATFFICRYLIYDIYDIRIGRIIRIEELVFAVTTLLAVFIVFLGASAYMPANYLTIFQDVYLVLMNALIGMKVACAFFIIFYRYIGIERK
ncbi:MAG: DUF4040 domain-containing protein [Oscillospiraceae bacterium]|nr:DUF4040 domain-containing protein [Oscillospiraceae bacterium]